MSPAASALRWCGGVLGVLVLMAGALQAADHLAQHTTESVHSYSSTAGVEIVADGEVTVTTGGTVVEVRTHARTGLVPAGYTADEVAEQLRIRHECEGVLGSSCAASLEVRVPKGVQVTVRSSSGAVSVFDVVGDVQVSTNLGGVTVEGVTGRVVATTGSGAVDVRDVGGPVEASTQIGPVLVRGVGGAVTAHSASGDVDIRDAGGSVEASTHLGRISVRGVQGDATLDAGSGRLDVAAVRGDVRATTNHGRVVVRSTGEPVALDIATANGRSTVDAPTDRDAPRSVYIRSGSGDVSYVDDDATR